MATSVALGASARSARGGSAFLSCAGGRRGGVRGGDDVGVVTKGWGGGSGCGRSAVGAVVAGTDSWVGTASATITPCESGTLVASRGATARGVGRGADGACRCTTLLGAARGRAECDGDATKGVADGGVGPARCWTCAATGDCAGFGGAATDTGMMVRGVAAGRACCRCCC